ncbi:pyridoxamine 5'-phosphate oxidase family protein [Clostridium botulinum]|uniref:pyridoxamine 5'-phosphate oxidase family protein n=1 Tax=Clostridium botulinum TaxID=1491 RepID=UPI001747FA6A|nr:pyridoxamine 5'-phosphate oxidase family protein [Clostridium botulinum]MBD5639691.1 pyridoxamine 5'-phosphate oxidase family protein [Clostridium botulinum]
MSKTYDFLKECGVFHVLTMNNEFPAGRPFGAVMEYNGGIYFSTANMKDVYKQLIENSNMQIIALKQGTREWIRISGKAIECKDVSVKQRMLEECPVLTKHFESAECKFFALFEVTDMISYLNTDIGSEKIS